VEVPGRSCPLTYRYRPEALAQPAQLEADTLYVVGGLYGNPAALRALLERADREPGGAPAMVFSGDAHWLTSTPTTSRRSPRRSWATTPSRAMSRPSSPRIRTPAVAAPIPTTSATTSWSAPTRS
jgi:hypothetical protein